jgi:TolA-binding protein
MLEVTRQEASDALRLEVESHLEECRACDAERARWRLLGVVKDHPAPRLGHGAERRILDQMLAASRRATGKGAAPLQRRARWVPVAAMAGALVAAAVLFAGRLGGFAIDFGFGPPAVAEGQSVDATAPGSVTFGGATIAYQAGTLMTMHPHGRTLRMSRGEVDVDVTPGLPGHFRVVTDRFIVEVLGTRFVVTLDGVRTLRGRVRVLDQAGHDLATLTAGASWNVNALPAVPAPAAAPPAPDTQPAGETSRAASVAPPRRALPSVPDLLVRSRAALARGDARQARSLAQRAMASDPTQSELATAELLLADTLLVSRRRDEAIDAYRRVVRSSPRWPEAETAEFTIGQLLYERGSATEASAAFEGYLAHYPHGRFAREAREHLARTQRTRTGHVQDGHALR